MAWNGKYWERDGESRAVSLAKATARAMVSDARQWMDRINAELEAATSNGTLDAEKATELTKQAKAAKALFAHAARSMQAQRLKAMLFLAQSEPGIEVKPEAFDTDDWLLNVSNGTLDLRTAQLRTHRREDLLTRGIAIPYDPKATCPQWEAFLWRIMGGTVAPDAPDISTTEMEARAVADARVRALVAFLQRMVGYTLTGSTREQCLFLLYGRTKTGKSTFLGTIGELMGPYGKQAETSTFLYKERDEVRNDLADLAGSRYVSAVETQQGRRLAEALVKRVTGGTDKIKAASSSMNTSSSDRSSNSFSARTTNLSSKRTMTRFGSASGLCPSLSTSRRRSATSTLTYV